MADSGVGQLARLHAITAEQLASYPSRAVAFLGVAGGNGLDLVDLGSTDVVVGYDINPAYLSACESRHRGRLGKRLRLVEASVDRSLRIERVDLLVANLIVEYVGVEEFVAFLVANALQVGVVSCVVQRNEAAGFVSATEHESAFAGLVSVASDVDPDVLESRMTGAGFEALDRRRYPLPNGKSLLRQDFRVGAVADHRTDRHQSQADEEAAVREHFDHGTQQLSARSATAAPTPRPSRS